MNGHETLPAGRPRPFDDGAASALLPRPPSGRLRMRANTALTSSHRKDSRVGPLEVDGESGHPEGGVDRAGVRRVQPSPSVDIGSRRHHRSRGADSGGDVPSPPHVVRAGRPRVARHRDSGRNHGSRVGTGWNPAVPVLLWLCGADRVISVDHVDHSSDTNLRRTLSLLHDLAEDGTFADELAALRPDRVATLAELADPPVPRPPRSARSWGSNEGSPT